MNIVFPFPDRENSFPLLQQDHEYKKLDSQQVDEVFDMAWQTGVDAAAALMEKEELPLDFFRIAANEGIRIMQKAEDNVAGGLRFYSEFYPKTKEIFLYNGSIRLWCAANELSMENGKMLILAHEYFHYLESTVLGWTSKKHQVHMLRLGGKELGKTGISSLSEIGANAFAYTCFEHMRLDGEAIVEIEETAEEEKPKKKITFWNRRKEELHEIYDQFFKF